MTRSPLSQVSFDEARRRVERAWTSPFRGGWFTQGRPFMAALNGGEDADHYLVVSAYRPIIPVGYTAADFWTTLVDKRSGRVEFSDHLKRRAKVLAMTPIASSETLPPPDPEQPVWLTGPTILANFWPHLAY